MSAWLSRLLRDDTMLHTSLTCATVRRTIGSMMSTTNRTTLRGLAEMAASYGRDEARVPHTKLSISLPSDLVETVREAAAESGLSVSATIGAALRRTLEDAEQASLDRALELDAEDSVAWANAYLPIAAKQWSEIEW